MSVPPKLKYKIFTVPINTLTRHIFKFSNLIMKFIQKNKQQFLGEVYRRKDEKVNIDVLNINNSILPLKCLTLVYE
jgi:hypothetical protein